MASVVFLRAANIGGRNVFKPAALAKSLPELDIVNIGAAGTFVVRASIAKAAVAAAVRSRLPFEVEMMICSGRDVARLAETSLFPQAPKEARRYVTVLGKRLAKTVTFPIQQPPGKDWQVKLVGAETKFVLSLWRRIGKRLLYPNEVVEKQLRVPGTTRNWNTIEKVVGVLEG